MHSADGMLIAFTGQTGNDFMQVLKGGNASRAVTDHTDHDAADNTSPLSRASEKSEQTPARTASLAVQRPTLSAAVSQGSENNGVTPAFPVRAEQHPATVKSTVSPMLAGIDGADRVDGKTSDNLALQAFPADRPATGAATANTPGAAIPSAGKGPKSPDARVFSAASPVDEKSSPAGGTVLIFASSEQTSSMKGGSSEGYLPFGLTPSANVFPKNSPSTTSFSPQGKPLKLGSYQRLLAYSGKM
jgi:hypothetical protein